MNESLPLPAPAPDHRVLLMEELYERYGKGTRGLAGLTRGWRFWRKKYAWFLVVGGATAIKRALDILVSLIMLVVLLPLFAVVALLIKLTDWGPVLFWQVRVGRWGREFPFPKFRSMHVHADQLLATGEKRLTKPRPGERDPRVTRIGRIIRKLSIDELPQLWCVLLGHMSLVGPRPPVPREVAQYSLAERRRLDVTPGLTCIWQVSGRSNIEFPQQVELDVQYIRSQSVWLDLKLLLKTIPAVLTGRGAY
jgi:lipopolysaccharide/colanic/teichoic acid biosynthesis glycosyltransferase